MKTVAVFLIAVFSFIAVSAQPGNLKPGPKSPVMCKNLKDSASYSLGYNIGQSLMQRYAEMDPNMIAQAIKDAYAQKTAAVDVNVGQTAVQNFLMKEVQKKANANKAVGIKFLAENKKKPNIITTASGLQYEVITMGAGEKPKASDNVKVNYAGTLISGKEFDNSARHGGPAQFNVGGVIAGWTEALQLMPVGSKFKLYIPANLAYGDSEMGAEIPAGSTLIFEVELIEIVK